jgi:hypothetical protein
MGRRSKKPKQSKLWIALEIATKTIEMLREDHFDTLTFDKPLPKSWGLDGGRFDSYSTKELVAKLTSILDETRRNEP